MLTYTQEFIEFMVRAEVLTFGDFTTKTGRKTPFFINTVRYRTGKQMNEPAGFHADAVLTRAVDFDFLFSPAYKGIPLVLALATELSRRGTE